MNTQGTVTEVTVRQGVSKAGKPYTLYGLAIDGARFGLDKPFDAPLCKQGDVIEFFAGKNNAGYDTASSVVVVAAGTAPAAAAVAAQAAPVAPQQAAVGVTSIVAAQAAQATPFVDTRQISIEYQCCMKTASWMLPIMFEQEAIVFPKSAKASDKYDTINALYNELVATQYLQLQEIKDAGGVQVEDVLDEEVGG